MLAIARARGSQPEAAGSQRHVRSSGRHGGLPAQRLQRVKRRHRNMGVASFLSSEQRTRMGRRRCAGSTRQISTARSNIQEQVDASCQYTTSE
jgi:hypothetical protein